MLDKANSGQCSNEGMLCVYNTAGVCDTLPPPDITPRPHQTKLTLHTITCCYNNDKSNAMSLVQVYSV